MANRKAKSIVKRAFEELGIQWNNTLEYAWTDCVRGHFFDGYKQVWEYMWICYSYWKPGEQEKVREKYSESLVW